MLAKEYTGRREDALVSTSKVADQDAEMQGRPPEPLPARENSPPRSSKGRHHPPGGPRRRREPETYRIHIWSISAPHTGLPVA